jgi:hypothetical protein
VTALVAALVATSMMASSATAASPIDPDGTVHACYKKRGKHKGAVRLSRKCKRKEKAATWNQPTDLTSIVGDIQDLQTTVNSLTSQVTTLQGILSGISNQDLTDVINGLPAVQSTLDDVCDQLSTVTDQSNAISDVVDELLTVDLPVLGISLDSLLTGSLPADLPAFACT